MDFNLKKGIIASIILVLLVISFPYFNRVWSERNFIKEKTVNLSDEQRKIYEDRLTESEQKLKSDLSDDEKYEWFLVQSYQYHGLGKLQDAKNSVLKAIKIHADKYNAYSFYYQIQMDMEDINGARDSIKKAIELDSSQSDLWKKYIQLEKDKFGADTNRLSDLYKEALDKTGENIDMVTAYAQFLESIGNLQGAIDQWEKAKTNYFEDPPPVYQGEIDRLKKLL
jgi:tetratricopeptide (TPR) repeat protein